LVGRQGLHCDGGVIGEGLSRKIGPLVVEPRVGRRGDGRAIRIQHDDAAAWRERAHRLIEESSRPGEVMEDVDEDEVRESSVRIGKRLRVGDLRRPRRWLDIGCLDPRTRVLERADAGAELDRTTGDRRQSCADLAEPALVQCP